MVGRGCENASITLLVSDATTCMNLIALRTSRTSRTSFKPNAAKCQEQSVTVCRVLIKLGPRNARNAQNRAIGLFPPGYRHTTGSAHSQRWHQGSFECLHPANPSSRRPLIARRTMPRLWCTELSTIVHTDTARARAVADEREHGARVH